MKFKTLIYKDPKKQKWFSKYATIINFDRDDGELGGCSTPQLMGKTITLENLEVAYPGIDFSEVELIEVTLTYEGDKV
jgi:hypothetical protein